MQSAAPIVKDLVLVGGGHSHVAVLKRFGMRPVPGVRLTLITREAHAPYSGMLPAYLAGHYAFDEAHIDLRPLCRFAGARLFIDDVTGLDLDARRVACASRPAISYDVLSLNLGSTPRADLPGAEQFALPVKPVSAFLTRWRAALDRLSRADQTTLDLVVVGGGAGGIELLLSVQHRLNDLLAQRDLPAQRIRYTLVSASERPLASFNRRTSRIFSRILAERGIQTHFGQRVRHVDARTLRCDSGLELPHDELLWVTTPSAAPWLADTGLATTDRGFIAVDGSLQSTSHPGVFAAGDCATILDHPRPKSGVFAVRAGPPLAENLRRALLTKPLKAWTPQRAFLSLISTGDEFAVGDRGPFTFRGPWVWRLKQWIDTTWMNQWRDLPQMDHAPPPVDPGLADADARAKLSQVAMRCGGCGAKVGATALERALGRLQPTANPGVLVGLDSPDDAAVIDVPDGHVAVQSVDYFRAFIDDPFTLGRVAANHALGDLWAMGASPHSALAIATVPFAVERKTEETLFQLLAGATHLLDEAGATLAGGHSSEGAELAFGLCVTGFARPAHLLRKGGLRPGDALILTKPLGTGALFAAEMRQRARGRWIEAALDHMVQPSALAAKILLEHSATACTDVTGFGLLGHLLEMVRACAHDVDVELNLDSLPALDGALETFAQGITSSLHPENLRSSRAIRSLSAANPPSAHPAYPLLFDPQTAGGLLASLPADRADACAAALRDAGYAHARIIGTVAPQDPHHPTTPIRLRCAL